MQQQPLMMPTLTLQPSLPSQPVLPPHQKFSLQQQGDGERGRKQVTSPSVSPIFVSNSPFEEKLEVEQTEPATRLVSQQTNFAQSPLPRGANWSSSQQVPQDSDSPLASSQSSPIPPVISVPVGGVTRRTRFPDPAARTDSPSLRRRLTNVEDADHPFNAYPVDVSATGRDTDFPDSHQDEIIPKSNQLLASYDEMLPNDGGNSDKNNNLSIIKRQGLSMSQLGPSEALRTVTLAAPLANHSSLLLTLSPQQQHFMHMRAMNGQTLPNNNKKKKPSAVNKIGGSLVESHSEFYVLTVAMMMGLNASLSSAEVIRDLVKWMKAVAQEEEDKEVQAESTSPQQQKEKKRREGSKVESHNKMLRADAARTRIFWLNKQASLRVGSGFLLPSLKIKFEDYYAEVFSSVRRLSGVDDVEYRESLCRTDFNFIRFAANSKSGQFFFFSHDGRFLVKTAKTSELHILLDMLDEYQKHLEAHPDSLLMRICGLHAVELLVDDEENDSSTASSAKEPVEQGVNSKPPSSIIRGKVRRREGSAPPSHPTATASSFDVVSPLQVVVDKNKNAQSQFTNNHASRESSSWVSSNQQRVGREQSNNNNNSSRNSSFFERVTPNVSSSRRTQSQEPSSSCCGCASSNKSSSGSSSQQNGSHPSLRKLGALSKALFIVALNVNHPDVGLHAQFDLKGSTLNRWSTPSEDVKKDLNWLNDPYGQDLSKRSSSEVKNAKKDNRDSCKSRNTMELSDYDKVRLLKAHEADCKFLAKYNLLDYSILLSVHDVGKAQSGDGGGIRRDVKINSSASNVPLSLAPPASPVTAGPVEMTAPNSHLVSPASAEFPSRVALDVSSRPVGSSVLGGRRSDGEHRSSKRTGPSTVAVEKLPSFKEEEEEEEEEDNGGECEDQGEDASAVQAIAESSPFNKNTFESHQIVRKVENDFSFHQEKNNLHTQTSNKDAFVPSKLLESKKKMNFPVKLLPPPRFLPPQRQPSKHVHEKNFQIANSESSSDSEDHLQEIFSPVRASKRKLTASRMEPSSSPRVPPGHDMHPRFASVDGRGNLHFSNSGSGVVSKNNSFSPADVMMESHQNTKAIPVSFPQNIEKEENRINTNANGSRSVMKVGFDLPPASPAITRSPSVRHSSTEPSPSNKDSASSREPASPHAAADDEIGEAAPEQSFSRVSVGGLSFNQERLGPLFFDQNKRQQASNLFHNNQHNQQSMLSSDDDGGAYTVQKILEYHAACQTHRTAIEKQSANPAELDCEPLQLPSVDVSSPAPSTPPEQLPGTFVSQDGSKIYFVGIIDFLTKFTAFKKFESAVKTVRFAFQGGQKAVSCANPVFYAHRQLEFLKHDVLDLEDHEK